MSVDESDQGLFVLDPGLRRESLPVSAVPVDKTFRPFVPDQNFLLPPSLDGWLPADHMARFIADLVDEHLDLSRIHAAYMNKKGGPPYDPRLTPSRLMVRVLIFGYATGVRSSRKLEAGCVDVVAFGWLAGGDGTGLPVDRAVPQTTPGSVGPFVRPSVGVVSGSRDGQTRSGRH